MNKKLNLSILIAVAVLAFSGAARAETFFAYLNGAQENPAVATSATGYARVFLNESTLTINYTVVYNGLSAAQNAGHIHSAALGVNGPVAIAFPVVGGTSGTITGTSAITAPQIATLRANGMYVNIHTSAFPGGEIRGQLGKKRPVDFDGDGRQDFSVLRFPAAGSPRPITFWNYNSTTGTQIFGTWGNSQTDYPAPGDYDGDGRDDFALFRANAIGAQSEFWIIKSSDFTVRYFAWGIGGDIVCARDFDGDGITDPAVFRRGASAGAPSTWYIRRSSNGTVQTELFGTTGGTANDQDFPIPGDYDGDGKYDVAVYRAGALTPTNSFIVKRSSDGGITYRQFGNFVSDYILPGDYDGDGKFDYAVARTGATSTTPMVWWILQSGTGTVRVQPWGITSDFPVQGDYDGDARTDVAVFRQGAAAGAASHFWVLGSFSNSTQVTQWGVNPDFPIARFDSR
ncbi:MAG: CHRD domain-containing protein [Pyrinomonadaceae bacterium]